MSKEIDLDLDLQLEEAPVAKPEVSRLGSRTQMVAHYSHCEICSGRLHFTHVTDFRKNTTAEKAICPECGVGRSEILHRLQ